MRLTLKQFLIGTIVLTVGVGGYFSLQSRSEPNVRQPRQPVQVVRTGLAEQKAMPITISSNGYITAINTVDIRPQIQNIVRAIHVREGQDVRAGQLLLSLDARSDSANLDKARAQFARDNADVAEAEMALKRNQELLAKNFVSQAVVDTARNKVDALRATLKADQAAIQAGSISLGTNQISASISGRIGTINVHPGSLAQPTGTPLLTIAQLDPIAVSFSVPEREITAIIASYPNGEAPVIAQLSNHQEWTGKLVFIDNTSDSQSGTIRMKAQFANPDRKMWPGTFVNVRLISRTLPDAVVIPSQAIVTGPANKFVYVVQADETVQTQKIDVVTIEQGEAAVSGLSAGTRIVIEGTQNLRPGAKVKEMHMTSPGTEKNKKSDQKGMP